MKVAKHFVGRKAELAKLKALHKKSGPGLAVIKGRRRVGKSSLVQYFAQGLEESNLWDFAGLAPEKGMDSQSQRDHFARQLVSKLGTAPLTFADWTDAFEFLESHVKDGDLVLLDEISWMGSKDPSFIPKLKAWWDRQQKQFTMVFCGSVSTWIEENILKSAAFFGRVNLTMTLGPLSISEAYQLLKKVGFQGSSYEAFKILAIVGGIPWYIEQMGPGESADEMIRQLCFEKDGLLVLEFDRIFHDLCDGRGESYRKILDSLKDGMKNLAEIRKVAGFSSSGSVSAQVEHLVTAGFVEKQTLWAFKTTKPLKQSLYRISDPYMRFYLKVLEPNRGKINLGAFETAQISKLPGFEAHLGLQLEQLLLQNRGRILKAIGVHMEDVLMDGPYRQSKTSSRAGCQIDYLVQTSTKNLFLCEFKFKRRELGSEIIGQMKEKAKALQVPRGFAAIPVLLHLGGVSSSVGTASYFYRIIDVADFLEA